MAISPRTSYPSQLRLLFTGIVTLLAFASWPDRRSQAEDPAEKAGTGCYLRCPECGLEMTCLPQQKSQPPQCPRCARPGLLMEFHDSTSGVVMEPFKGKRFPLVMVGIVSTLAVTLAILRRLQTVRKNEEQDQKPANAEALAEQAKVVKWQRELGHGLKQDSKKRDPLI